MCDRRSQHHASEGSGSNSNLDWIEAQNQEAGGKAEIIFCMTDRKSLGLTAHYFSNGFIMGCYIASMFGLVYGFLGMPAYMTNATSGILQLPGVFAFFIGMVSDCRPILGQHRRPYMVLGWAIASTALVILSCWPLPKPYYCIVQEGDSAGELAVGDPPCNPDARHSFTPLVLLLLLLATGMVMAASGAHALVMDYAQREPPESRGSTQASLMIIEKVGGVLAVLISAFGFNGKEYFGTFDQSSQLNFNQMCIVMAGPAVLALLLSIFSLQELPLGATKQSLRKYVAEVWELLSSKAFFFFVMYQFWNAFFLSTQTTAQQPLQRLWAGVGPMQRELAGLIGHLSFALGAWLGKKYLLQVSWPKLLMVLLVCGKAIHSIQVGLTVFDVVRNPYVFLGQGLSDQVLQGMIVLINLLIGNEMADDDRSGLVSGIISTSSCISAPLAMAVGNQVFSLFKPSLSDVANYVSDTPQFRLTVAGSYALQYGMGIFALGMIALLPRQKDEAHERLKSWPRHRAFAVVTSTILICALMYDLAIAFASLSPTLYCLRIAGGDGCNS